MFVFAEQRFKSQNSSDARMPRNFDAKLQDKLNFYFEAQTSWSKKLDLRGGIKFMFLYFPLVTRFQDKKHKLGGLVFKCCKNIEDMIKRYLSTVHG